MTNFVVYFTDVDGNKTKNSTLFCSEEHVRAFIRSAIEFSREVIFKNKPTMVFEDKERVTLREISGKRELSWEFFEVVRGQQEFTADEVFFDEEVIENFECGLLEFYVPVYFDTKKILGEQAVPKGYGYVSVYAFYDLKKGDVKDDLFIVVVDGDSAERHYLYSLSKKEKAIFHNRMLEYNESGWSFSEAEKAYKCEYSISEWFIAYPDGYEYVQGDSFKNERINELLAEGYSKENIHVFPAETELK
jgi:hypothetical protein